jgi:hypothetical protein
MPDKPPTPRIPVAVASAVVLLLCTLLYVVVAALGDAPAPGRLPALTPATPPPLLCHDEGIWAR